MLHPCDTECADRYLSHTHFTRKQHMNRYELEVRCPFGSGISSLTIYLHISNDLYISFILLNTAFHIQLLPIIQTHCSYYINPHNFGHNKITQNGRISCFLINRLADSASVCEHDTHTENNRQSNKTILPNSKQNISKWLYIHA